MTEHHWRIETLHFRLLAPGCFEHPRIALSTFAELAELLQRHIKIEDRVILSTVAETAANPQDRLLARHLTGEHREIEARLDALWVQFLARDAEESIRSHLEALDSMLSRHIQREELIAYPAYDTAAQSKSALPTG